MRHKRAVEKLRLLTEECERVSRWPLEDEDEPFLVSVYAFGDVLEGADPLKAVQVAGVIRLPPEEVPWGSSPHGTEWLADIPRLSKGGYEYWWRSYLDPVWNHYVRSPVRIWSQDGPDTETLDALTEHRFSDLHRLTASPVDEKPDPYRWQGMARWRIATGNRGSRRRGLLAGDAAGTGVTAMCIPCARRAAN